MDGKLRGHVLPSPVLLRTGFPLLTHWLTPMDAFSHDLSRHKRRRQSCGPRLSGAARRWAPRAAGRIAEMPSLAPLLAALAAYLLGSLAFAVIVSKVMGLSDPRTFGSKNPGATNVLRSGSKPAAIVTLLLDALKGLVPVLLVKLYGARFGLAEGTVAMVGLAAFVGHLYPVFFRFQGGKGVATFIGVVFGIHWILGLATCLTWLIIAFFFRYSSLASLVAAVFAPVYYLLGDRLQWYAERPVAVALFAMALLLAWRHRGNIERLLEGKESKLGAKKAS
jgi:acyl phosphate:glycerol-3-phosphate acyltransferase